MNFKLDQSYFNRSGEEVKYVGFKDGNYYFQRRGVYKSGYAERSLPLYCTDSDGKSIIPEHDLDILGKWELSDDPDRVYVIDDEEFRIDDIGGKLNRPLRKSRGDFGFVTNILIKSP